MMAITRNDKLAEWGAASGDLSFTGLPANKVNKAPSKVFDKEVKQVVSTYTNVYAVLFKDGTDQRGYRGLWRLHRRKLFRECWPSCKCIACPPVTVYPIFGQRLAISEEK